MKFLAKNNFIVILIIVFSVNAILDKVFNIDYFLARILISLVFVILLAPRKKKIKTVEGEKTQITWFLLKDPIILEK